MSTTILYTIISLSLLGAVAAVVLYFVAQRFKVFEDPRIDLVEAELPAANCGGCGYAGCRNLAETMVKSDSFDGLFCPVGGNEVMARIAACLAGKLLPRKPGLLCLVVMAPVNSDHEPIKYDGTQSCAIASALYSGETGCNYGCHGFGDCVAGCTFDALHMDRINRITGG